jgi:hypothetical protein
MINPSNGRNQKMNLTLDYKAFLEYISTEEGVDLMADTVWKGSPRDYEIELPEVMLSEIPKTSIEIDKIIEQFTYCHGVLEDFRRRLALFQAERKLHFNISVITLSECPEAVKREAVRNKLKDPELEILEFEVLERFRVPEIPSLFVNMPLAGKVSLDKLISNVISAIPSLYRYALDPNNITLDAIKNGVTEKTASYIKAASEMVIVTLRELEAEERIRRTWFQNWTSSNPWPLS